MLWLASFFWISSAITMMIGSIPQQDVFQRVMSARNVQTAVAGPVIGGCVYILFAFVPMFIVIAAILVMPGSDSIISAKWQCVNAKCNKVHTAFIYWQYKKTV